MVDVKIKVVYVSPFSLEHLLALPSNFSYYIKEMINSGEFDVILLNPQNYKGNLVKRTWKMARDIRIIDPDILYLTLWLGFYNLIFAKILGLIKCKVVIWKYTYCINSKNAILHLFYKYIYWANIDRVYMMFDNHTEDAVKKKLLKVNQVLTVSRGADIEWYSKFFIPSKSEEFSVIATGKDHRDYFTLGKACEETKTQCHIITFKHQSCLKAAEQFKDSKYVHFTFIENGYDISKYTSVVEEVAKASVMAICCEKLPYGAGYTNIVECLAFRIPIIQTLNPDVHLDPEKEGIGFSVQPYDVEGWKEKITLLKSDKGIRDKMAANIQRLLDGEYNSINTSAFIMNDFKNMVVTGHL